MAAETCIIGQGIHVNGQLAGSGSVEIEGRLDGEVSLEGDLTILPEGQVVATIEVQTLVVQGHLEGEILAHDLISLEEGSVVIGNLKAPRVRIAEGAKFKGNIDMDVHIDA